MNRKIILLTAGILVFLSGAALQRTQTILGQSISSDVHVPRQIALNGTLKDRTGHPLTGVVGVRLAIYRYQDSGSPLWVETQNAQLDEQGHYSVQLGAVNGLSAEFFASGEARWLGVQALVPGEEEQTRVVLVSVPYALKAADADTVGGMPASAFVLANSDKDAAGSAIKSSPDEVPVILSASGTGSTDKIARWIDGAGTLGDSSMSQDSSGFIGIGTAAPGGALDVWKNTGVNQRWRYAGGGNYFMDLNQTNPGPGLITWNFDVTNNGRYWPNNLVLDRGNVGIGTGAPGAPLEIGVNTGTNQRWRYSNGGSFWMDLNQTNPAGGVITWNFDVINNGGNYTNNLVLDRGNVGIGVAIPSATLDVAGNAQATGSLSGSQLISTIATGTAPLVVTSTTQVANLNASLLGGLPASSFGDITAVTAGTGLTGGATSGAASLSLSTAALTHGITYLAGCDTCGVLADTDDQKTIYLNVVGPMTVQSVTCFSDAGAPTVNIVRDSGPLANILTSDLPCSTTGATTTGFVGAQAVLNLNDKVDFVMVSAGGVAKRVTLSIKTTLN